MAVHCAGLVPSRICEQIGSADVSVGIRLRIIRACLGQVESTRSITQI